MSNQTAVTTTPVATVHWIGTGLSTGSGVRALTEQGRRVVLWGRTAEKAASRAHALGVEVAASKTFSLTGLSAELSPGDVVVSMLPAAQHPDLLQACISAGAHFACSSYTSPEIAELAEQARGAGLVVLTEAGLDPGIDHLFAHVLLRQAVAELGTGPATVSLTSYCGGVPAVANDFKYLFSWAPAGVLTALLSPARYVAAGAVLEAARPWQAVGPLRVDGEEFEVYPNRDSVPFIAQYGVPSEWVIETFVRGTLRLPGWSAAWAPVFAELEERGRDCVPELAADLARRYPMTAADRDRVVLVVNLEVRTAAGRAFSAGKVLDLTGDATETAMARCVSLPLAVGITRLLDGALPAGLSRAGETAGEAQRWLDDLAAMAPIGILATDTAKDVVEAP